MNKPMLLFAGTALTLSLVGAAFAQSTTPAAKPPAAATMPADKPATPKVAPHRMTAEVVAVNPEARTLTVKHGAKGKEVTFAVDGDAASHLGDFKTGDQVKISYAKSHDQLIASQISKTAVAKAK
jgi:Cu/Ag efflux protein CusF